MSENLRALAVILVAASLVYIPLTRVATIAGVSILEFRKLYGGWIICSIALFGSYNYTIFLIFFTSVVWVLVLLKVNLISLYMIMLTVAQPISTTITALGLGNHLLEINHIRLLSAILMVPVVFSGLHKIQQQPKIIWPSLAGWILYCLLIWIMNSASKSPTELIRLVIYDLLAILIPVLSVVLYVNSLSRLRGVLIAFICICGLIGLIATFEMLRGWLLYSNLDSIFGLRWGFGNYLFRGEGGLLRAQVSTGHPIILGYLLMLGLICWSGLFEKNLKYSKSYILTGALIFSGLIAALSRGPWVGAIIGCGFMWALSFLKSMRAMIGLFLLAVVIYLLSKTQFGALILSYLPFVGGIESENVEYRIRLIEITSKIILQNIWFGSQGMTVTPEMENLRQGQGIIDVVNSYIGILLSLGLIGLVLFMLPVLIGMTALFRNLRNSKANFDSDGEKLIKTILCCNLAILVVLGTTSSVGIIPAIYWIFFGIQLSLLKIVSSKTGGG